MDMQNLLNELINCRNELCLKCGVYRNSHNGACDGCRYNFENMMKWDAIEERPIAEWVTNAIGFYCSNCGMYGCISDCFCPHCGARMGGNDNG